MSEPRILLGCVEQAVTGGLDPLVPPISVSRNGTLAKWRDKIQLLDLRVNDPGLARFRPAFEETIEKARSLGLETIITLPEYNPEFLEPPPPKPEDPKPPKATRPAKESKEAREARHAREREAVIEARQLRPYGKPVPVVPVVWFKPCYLAVPRTLPEPDTFQTLTVDDCAPIIDLAGRFGLRHVVVPVSEPGLFLDPAAVDELRAKVKALASLAKAAKVRLHLRTGGLSLDVFKRLQREIGCGLAFNAGTADLERLNLAETYTAFRDHIEIVYLHQVLPGIDKWKGRREAIAAGIKQYRQALAEFKAAGPGAAERRGKGTPLGALLRAWHAYQDACKNPNAHLGLFQNGEINLRPLLRCIKEDLDAGHERLIVLETVPNMKNAEVLERHLVPEAFTGSL